MTVARLRTSRSGPQCCAPDAGTALRVAAGEVTLDQLIATRRLLEVPAAREAARARTEEQLAELRHAEFDPAGAAGPETFAANQDFHLILLRATGNPLLEVIAAPLFRVLATRLLRETAPDGFWVCVADDHAELYDLVAAQDVDGAGEAMGRHLDHMAAGYRVMHQAGA